MHVAVVFFLTQTNFQVNWLSLRYTTIFLHMDKDFHLWKWQKDYNPLETIVKILDQRP